MTALEALSKIRLGEMRAFDTFDETLSDGNTQVSCPRSRWDIDDFPETLIEKLFNEATTGQKNLLDGTSPLVLLPSNETLFNDAIECIKGLGATVLDARGGYQAGIEEVFSTWPPKAPIIKSVNKEYKLLLIIAGELTEEGGVFWRILYDRSYLATGGEIPPTEGLSKKGLLVPQDVLVCAIVSSHIYFNQWTSGVRSKIGSHFHFNTNRPDADFQFVPEQTTNNSMDRSGGSPSN
jgi:hypothetical protein